MAKKNNSAVSDAWYTSAGINQDVVVSSCSTLRRNLANFPFPSRLHESEAARIQSIMFDAFNFLPDAGEYQAVSLEKLDDVGRKIMHERSILESTQILKGGIIMRNDGRLACTVNTDDHVVMSSFKTGLALDDTTRSVYDVDCELQKHVQYAASYDFGYLTNFVLNSGSGLTLSAVLHLPSCSLLQEVGNLAQKLSEEGFDLRARYGSGGFDNVSGYGSRGSALGAYYRLTTKSSAGGTEIEQLASMRVAVQEVMKAEVNARKKCRSSHVTEIANYTYRSLALAKSSFFINLRESVDIISGVKFGADLGILNGIESTELHALLYRVQEGHLEYVLNTGKFKFEKDIQDNKAKQIERLRALILQESFEGIEKL
ncbi:hypothetical protein [Treponema sp.]|uniref:hypothetical protein n=1 Tax=Treponema sp. TaxID=166 RepID=UPI00298E02B2|nr:hypothetical protein [Treponema sp.]MCQ2241083.1 hypothetical protein [Treponema sp.]